MRLFKESTLIVDYQFPILTIEVSGCFECSGESLKRSLHSDIIELLSVQYK